MSARVRRCSLCRHWWALLGYCTLDPFAKAPKGACARFERREG